MKILAIVAVATGLGTALVGRWSPQFEQSRTPSRHAVLEKSRAVMQPSVAPNSPQHEMTAGHVRDRSSARADAVPTVPDAPGGPLDISGVHPIELSAQDLARLGMRADTDGVWMSWYAEESTQAFVWEITMRGVALPDDGDRTPRLEAPHLTPVLITDDRGMKRAFITSDSSDGIELARALQSASTASDTARIGDSVRMRHEQALDRMVRAGRLVPIIVRTGHAFTAADSAARRWRPDCIVWYEPGPGLLALLPERVRKQLNAEITRAAAMLQDDRALQSNPVELPARSAEQSVVAEAGERPYLDILRSASGAVLSTRLYPNPAAAHATLSYRLARERIVTIALHDLTGRHLRDIASPQQKPEGTSETTIETADLADGVYLVVIATDKGERAVQRLIVRK